MRTSAKSYDSLSLTIALGILGGLLLVAFSAVLGTGPRILLGFGAIVLACVVAIRTEQIGSFKTRFLIAMGSLVISSLIVYFAAATSPGTSLLSFGGHSWRLLFILAASALVSLPMARLSRSLAT